MSDFLNYITKQTMNKVKEKRFQKYYSENITYLNTIGVNSKSLPQNFLAVLVLNRPDEFKRKINVIKEYNYFKGSMQPTEIFVQIDELLNERKSELTKAFATIKKQAIKNGATETQANSLVEKFSSVVNYSDVNISALAKQAVRAMNKSKSLGLHYELFANKARAVITTVTDSQIQEIYDTIQKNFLPNKQDIVTVMDKCSGLVTSSNTYKITEIAKILKDYETELANKNVKLDVAKIIKKCPSILSSSNSASDIKNILDFLSGKTPESKKYCISLNAKQLKDVLENDASILTFTPDTLLTNIKQIHNNIKPLLTSTNTQGKTVVDTAQMTKIISNLFVGKNRRFINNMNANYTRQNDAILKKHYGANALIVYQYCPLLLTLRPSILNHVLNTFEKSEDVEALKRTLITTNMNMSSNITVNNFLFNKQSKKIEELHKVSSSKTRNGVFTRKSIKYNEQYKGIDVTTKISTHLTANDKIFSSAIINATREIVELNKLANIPHNQVIQILKTKIAEYDKQLDTLIKDESYNQVLLETEDNVEMLSDHYRLYNYLFEHSKLDENDELLMFTAEHLLGEKLLNADLNTQLTALNKLQKEVMVDYVNPSIAKLKNEEEKLKEKSFMADTLGNLYYNILHNFFPNTTVPQIEETLRNKHPEFETKNLSIGKIRELIITNYGTEEQKLIYNIDKSFHKAREYSFDSNRSAYSEYSKIFKDRVKLYADDIAKDYRKELDRSTEEPTI